MWNYCSDCRNFNTSDKKAPGYCKCSKIKKYVFADQDACQNFDKSYVRKWNEKEKLHDEAKETRNKPTDSNIPMWVGIVFFIFALIIFFFFS